MYLIRTNISEIEPETWFGLDQLTKLYLNENKLTVLTAGMFNHLPALTSLVLNNNKISTIEPEAWFGLDQLTRLELDQNELGVFTAGMFNHLASLTFLDLGNNKISAIDSEAFSNLTSLMVLSFIHNSISVLRRDMFLDLPNLAELHFDYNRIYWIKDGAFNGVHSLRILDFQNNRLNSSIFTINVFINMADNLTSLTLNGNPITIIYNDTFTSFTVLEKLVMDDLDIIEPNGLRGLNSLQELFLSNIKWDGTSSSVWSEIGDTLTELSIQFTSIASMNENIFAMMPLLKTLTMSYCSIEVIHPDTSNTISNLEILNLRSNRISEVQIKNLQSLKGSLKFLNLENNRITAIQKDTFGGFTALDRLDLASNQISEIISGGFQGLPSLRRINMEHNSLTTLEWTAFNLMCSIPPGKYYSDTSWPNISTQWLI